MFSDPGQYSKASDPRSANRVLHRSVERRQCPFSGSKHTNNESQHVIKIKTLINNLKPTCTGIAISSSAFVLGLMRKIVPSSSSIANRCNSADCMRRSRPQISISSVYDAFRRSFHPSENTSSSLRTASHRSPRRDYRKIPACSIKLCTDCRPECIRETLFIAAGITVQTKASPGCFAVLALLADGKSKPSRKHARPESGMPTIVFCFPPRCGRHQQFACIPKTVVRSKAVHRSIRERRARSPTTASASFSLPVAIKIISIRSDRHLLLVHSDDLVEPRI